MERREFSERTGKFEDLDRSFDIQFWQGQTPAARASAAWALVVHAAKVKGIDECELRLDRSVGNLQQQSHSGRYRPLSAKC
jgi:hypothetical protein